MSVATVRALSYRYATSTTAPASRRQRIKLVTVLGLLTALGPFTFDMYLPALPKLTTSLHTTDSAVQLTLTGTLVGVALGQLAIGPLSDAMGRRRPLLAGICVHIVASVLCAVAPTVAFLGVMRVLQGLGAAAASVTAMAVVRDLYSGTAAANTISRLILVLGISPVLAPSAGSALLGLTDWRGIFAALAGIGALMLVMSAFGLRETLPPARRRSGGVVDSGRTYRRLFGDRTFVGLVLTAACTMGVVFAYVSGSSFVLQDEFGLTETQFGMVFAFNAIALIGAPQMNVVLLRRFAPQQILLGGLTLGAVAGSTFLLVALTGFGGLPGFLVPLFCTLFSIGLCGPNTAALALSRHGEAAGTAASLLGAIQSGAGAAAAPLVGLLGNDSSAMATVVLGLAGTAVFLVVVVVRPRNIGSMDGALPTAAAVAH
ncbi:DHA1 family bicyclomycin/chloramphenicol resistance-like MFS transporter [Motilibacter peucedani]|uniref:DHA1 family bicyclomycin/chloramphenicol resistance-like MFS transporter n=1 Tax=Motilibacter peucedani TaxID=598650 RepID=A0A420XRM1_9ACTN|nr:multidrug effflux MFS transporter [Motilibacter peucedani]RKS77528.1 DHA1 family bicyclomycin/chloramphenicol resistance-like MFS transporter [Motilibacter peucedani]